MEERKTEIELMYSISKILNTNLDRRVLAIVLQLIEMGIHPESIADGIVQIMLFCLIKNYPN
jgi:hypothetical protein